MIQATAVPADRRDTSAGSGRRILVAPVTISPTKPLTPTHLKYLLTLDLLHRATATFADVTFLYHHASYAGSRQVAGFWEYLDRCHPGLACDELTEEEIGDLYGAYHLTERVPYADLEPTVRRARDGWIHPVSARLLDLWEAHYRSLGMLDPMLGRTGPELADEAEVLALLVEHDLCIDARELGAPAYLDATSAGLPLRVVLGPDGQANYLLYLVRELLPQLADHDLIVLVHDPELRGDYQTVAHILTALGANVTRFEVPRVALDGTAQSTRLGGWQGYTLGAFAGPIVEEFGIEAFRLGLRLYLVAGLGRTARQSFSFRHLNRWVRRAQALLERHRDPQPADLGPYLAATAARRGYADPYRVATTLMSRDESVPVGGLLQIVSGRSENASRSR